MFLNGGEDQAALSCLSGSNPSILKLLASAPQGCQLNACTRAFQDLGDRCDMRSYGQEHYSPFVQPVR